MSTYKNKAYPLRLDNELMEKVRAIAKQEDRPLSKQFERIIREYINTYESKHGTIKNLNIIDNKGTINM